MHKNVINLDRSRSSSNSHNTTRTTQRSIPSSLNHKKFPLLRDSGTRRGTSHSKPKNVINLDRSRSSSNSHGTTRTTQRSIPLSLNHKKMPLLRESRTRHGTSHHIPKNVINLEGSRSSSNSHGNTRTTQRSIPS